MGRISARVGKTLEKLGGESAEGESATEESADLEEAAMRVRMYNFRNSLLY